MKRRRKDRRMVHRASENTGCTLHVYVYTYVCTFKCAQMCMCVWVYIHEHKLCVRRIQCERKDEEYDENDGWIHGEKGRERHRETEGEKGRQRARKRRGEATAIPDFHFNWTQRNIILNARNASETPIKRRRHFTLSPCTFVLIAGPIVAEVAIDYSSPEISRRNAPHVRRLAAGRIYVSFAARSHVVDVHVVVNESCAIHREQTLSFARLTSNELTLANGCPLTKSFAPNRSCDES